MSATAHAVLWGRLAWHPAVEAWNGFSDGPVEPPEHIEILQQSSTSATYRLVADGGGRSIVARRSLTPGASIERTVHERILPSLPVTSPRARGSSSRPRATSGMRRATRPIGHSRDAG